MNNKLAWTLVVFLIAGDITAIDVLRKVNNPLGYELISHNEIENMRANLNDWKNRAYKFYKKWRDTSPCAQ